ncbi:MAG: hypothetical protein L0Z49_14425, partial [Actinobacteria bacterium]|nr:hypothetical protein [Actinomycetota bacterium]
MTAATFETPGSGFRRQLTRTLPAGNQWTYTYYGNTETRSNPCDGGSPAVSQAGMLKLVTSPDPAGAAVPIIYEAVYDAIGRVVASRTGTGGWHCTSYDARGRISDQSWPAYGGHPARSASYDYAVGNDPRIGSLTDPAGTITTTIDLLGRTTSYEDVWDQVTETTYSQSGRVLQQTTPAGAHAFTYDDAGRLVTHTLGSLTLATADYDSGGDLVSVTYGNGTSGTVSRSMSGAVSGLEWMRDSTLLASDMVIRSQSGRVVDQS